MQFLSPKNNLFEQTLDLQAVRLLEVDPVMKVAGTHTFYAQYYPQIFNPIFQVIPGQKETLLNGTKQLVGGRVIYSLVMPFVFIGSIHYQSMLPKANHIDIIYDHFSTISGAVANDLMVASDSIGVTGSTPLVGHSRVIDTMTAFYDVGFAKWAIKAAEKIHLPRPYNVIGSRFDLFHPSSAYEATYYGTIYRVRTHINQFIGDLITPFQPWER